MKGEAADTTACFLKTLTAFLNNWTYAGRRLVKDTSGHWYSYIQSPGIIDRTPKKDKRRLCDLVCIHDSFAIVRSIAIEMLGNPNYQKDKKFTTMYFSPPYSAVMMANLDMNTAQG
jgi:hypothetical protein